MIAILSFSKGKKKDKKIEIIWNASLRDVKAFLLNY